MGDSWLWLLGVIAQVQQHEGSALDSICSAILENVDELCSLCACIIQRPRLLFNSEILETTQAKGQLETLDFVKI